MRYFMRFSARVSVVLLALGHLFNDFYCNFLPVLLPIIMPRLDLSPRSPGCSSWS